MWTVIGVLALAALWLVLTYNALVKLRVLADNAWSDVDVQLRRRAELVPNLVETVKGYATHERTTLDQVVAARARAVAAPSAAERIAAENQLTAALRQVFAVAEAYPELKANESFVQFQGQLAELEGELANGRRYYNAVVRDFNTKQLTFPTNAVAGLLGFAQRPFFEADDDERQAPTVRF